MQAKLITLFLMTVVSITSFSQKKKVNKSSTSNNHKFEVYGGYSHDFANGNISSRQTVALTGFTSSTNGSRKAQGFDGFNFSVTYYFSRYFGAMFDFAGYYGHGTAILSGGTFRETVNSGFIGIVPGIVPLKAPQSSYNYMGGIQFKDNSTKKKIKPFAHVLLGISQQSTSYKDLEDGSNRTIYFPNGGDKISNSGFAMAFGGGLDIHVSKRIDIRVIQFDYNPVFLKNKKLLSVGDPRTLNFFIVPNLVSIQDVTIDKFRQDNFRFGAGIVFH